MSSVAVLIPAFNQPAGLYGALSSAAWQLAQGDELIVVHDAPKSPPTNELGDAFPNQIFWLRHSGISSGSHLRNWAAGSARAEWLIFLEPDDVLAPFALQMLRKTAPKLESGVQVFAGGWHRVRSGHYHDYVEIMEGGFDNIRKSNPAPASATFIRREALVAVGGFDARIDFEEDWDLWLRLHERFGLKAFAVTDKPVSYLRDRLGEKHFGPRRFTVDGQPVREYFTSRYGVEPQ